MIGLFSRYLELPKEAKFLIYSAVLPFVAYGMFYTDLSYFLTSVQGFSIPLMGLIVTVIGISTFASAIPLGIAADKYGRKKLHIIGNVMASTIIAVFALTTNVGILLAAAVVEGISEAAFAASAHALLAEKAEEHRRTDAYSLFGFVQAAAFGVGCLSIPLVMVFEGAGFSNLGGHMILYVTLAVLSLSSTIFMLKINEPRREKRHGVSWHRMLPHKSRDPLVKYVVDERFGGFRCWHGGSADGSVVRVAVRSVGLCERSTVGLNKHSHRFCYFGRAFACS